MAYRLAELGEHFELLFTPTGNELPELHRHIKRVVRDLQVKLITPTNRSLQSWIEEYVALPNNRQRWCTRLIKIRPCADYLAQHPAILVVGLRADEMDREGGGYEKTVYRCPMREWGWKLADVLSYLKRKKIVVPRRTDCAWCYDQRLGEWYRLWKDYPSVYRAGEELEARVSKERGQTCSFRSPSRDTWPAPLVQLRTRFEHGDVPRGVDDEDAESERCITCRK